MIHPTVNLTVYSPNGQNHHLIALTLQIMTTCIDSESFTLDVRKALCKLCSNIRELPHGSTTQPPLGRNASSILKQKIKEKTHTNISFF